jgi:hypothetical protein
MEEIDYSILYRWFVGLSLDDQVWDATSFTKNRDRLLEAAVAKEFLAQVVGRAGAAGLISDEHFTVDGTLLGAWASLKSFQPKDKQDAPPDDPGNPTVNFHLLFKPSPSRFQDLFNLGVRRCGGRPPPSAKRQPSCLSQCRDLRLANHSGRGKLPAARMIISSKNDIPDWKECREVTVKMLR